LHRHTRWSDRLLCEAVAWAQLSIASSRPQSAVTTVREIEMHLLAKSSFGPNAAAIADEQHADHQFGSIEGRRVWL